MTARRSTCKSPAPAASPCAVQSTGSFDSRVSLSVQGAVFEASVPVGENLVYRAPAKLSAYAKLADGTSAAALDRKHSDKCRRQFQVGSRGDMRTTVKPILEELGVCVHLVQGCRPLRRHRPMRPPRDACGSCRSY